MCGRQPPVALFTAFAVTLSPASYVAITLVSRLPSISCARTPIYSLSRRERGLISASRRSDIVDTSRRRQRAARGDAP